MQLVKELVGEANSKITTLPAAEAIQLVKNQGIDVAFIDLRANGVRWAWPKCAA